MSKRAKRLAQYLEKNLGWTVYDDSRVCKCGYSSYGRERIYCAKCGEKLPEIGPKDDTIEQLEKAIAFAVKRT